MKSFPLLLLIAALLATAEGAAWWWMNPAEDPNRPEVPVLALDWQKIEADCAPISDEVMAPVLHNLPEETTKNIEAISCSEGKVARLDFVGGGKLFLAWFEWNQPDRSSASHIFYHMPDGCMGGKGFTFLGVDPPRAITVGDQRLVFDETRFKSPDGGMVHVFKASWAAGAEIDEEALMKYRSPQFRRYNLIKNRRLPSHGRMLMATFHGFTSSESAWSALQDHVLRDLESVKVATLNL